MGVKALSIRFAKVRRYIRVYDKTRSLLLFGQEK